MQLITAITNDAIQTLGITLDDGSTVNMQLNYIPAQQGWFYSLTYGSFEANFMRVVNSPNMIRKYRNIIPFGLACTTIDGYEIINQSDFISGRASIYALNQQDVIEVETMITVTLPLYRGDFIS